jgi:hypothetical protein
MTMMMLGFSAASTGADTKAINTTAEKILIAIFPNVNFLIVDFPPLETWGGAENLFSMPLD